MRWAHSAGHWIFRLSTGQVQSDTFDNVCYIPEQFLESVRIVVTFNDDRMPPRLAADSIAALEGAVAWIRNTALSRLDNLGHRALSWRIFAIMD